MLKEIIKIRFLVNKRDGEVINRAFCRIGEEEKYQIEINFFIFVIRFRFFRRTTSTSRIGLLYFGGLVQLPTHGLGRL